MNPGFVLITGASRGLGRFLSQQFWKSGYSLFLVARNIQALNELKTSLGPRKNQEIVLFDSDLSNPEAATKIASTIQSHWSCLDVLINNAAIHGPIGPLWENDMSLWNQAIQVNLLSPVALCHALVPWMKNRRRGSIINVSGGGATASRAYFSAYATAKTGLVRFTETLAEETRSFGIRVNCVAPGAMKTALLNEVIEVGPAQAGEKEYSIANKVFAENASLNDVAELFLFLASDQSQGITGKLISAKWDNWKEWPLHIQKLQSDIYTLRRVTDRG